MKLKTKDKEKVSNPLTELEAATAAVRTFETTHEKIFEKYRSLMETVDVATEAVKTWCKQHKANLDSERYTAEFSEGKSRWYDPVETRKILSDSLVVPEATIHLVITRGEETVDDAKLKQVAKLYNLDMKTFEPAYREEVTSARCTIKEKEDTDPGVVQ